MNTIKQILKDSISQMGLIENLSLPYIAMVLGTAFLCGMIIYVVYKYFYRGAVYSENFGLLIMMSTMTVSFIIMTISSNIVLSLGMVGALSIVRFRAAVKDPLDVGFLFLGIGAGLTAGAGLFFIAVIGTAVISVMFVCMYYFGRKPLTYLLVVSYEVKAEEAVLAAIKSEKYKLKSKARSKTRIEATYAIKVRNEDVLQRVTAIDGVEQATLVAYTGDGQY